jgi:hypothetical protein
LSARLKPSSKIPKSASRWLRRQFSEGFNALRNSLNWRFVRGIGELQILTRASYLLIVIVPVLATCWSQVGRVFGEAVAAETQLPWSLATLFFAALLIVIAHFIYQVAVPDLIKDATWDEFIAKRMEEFAKYKHEAAKASARKFLETKAGKRLDKPNLLVDTAMISDVYISMDKKLPDSDVLDKLSEQQVRRLLEVLQREAFPDVPAARNALVEYLQNYVDKTFPANSPGEAVFEMGVIERGARAEYLFRASRNVPTITLTMLLYIAAIMLICRVVWVQAENVAATARIHAPLDLLDGPAE